jgi:hypothetical protein
MQKMGAITITMRLDPSTSGLLTLFREHFRKNAILLHGLCQDQYINTDPNQHEEAIHPPRVHWHQWVPLTLNQQATDAPKKEDAKVEKSHSCAGHGDAKADGKACCAGKEGCEGGSQRRWDDAPACCAKMAKDGKACDHALRPKRVMDTEHAEAHLEGDGHDHGVMKAHVCTDACKEGAHMPTLVAKKGMSCSAELATRRSKPTNVAVLTKALRFAGLLSFPVWSVQSAVLCRGTYLAEPIT